MTLHAVVYKKKTTLPQHLQDVVRIVDLETGELEFVTVAPPNKHAENDLVATRSFLGNISTISWVTSELRSRFGNKCETLLMTFLQSGSHSGDVIRPDQMLRLKQEVEQILLVQDDLPAELTNFVMAIRELVSVAEKEKNPIVFV